MRSRGRLENISHHGRVWHLPPVINLIKRSRQDNILPPGGISIEEDTHSIVIAVVENRARVVCIAKIDTAVVNKFTRK